MVVVRLCLLVRLMLIRLWIVIVIIFLVCGIGLVMCG